MGQPPRAAALSLAAAAAVAAAEQRLGRVEVRVAVSTAFGERRVGAWVGGVGRDDMPHFVAMKAQDTRASVAAAAVAAAAFDSASTRVVVRVYRSNSGHCGGTQAVTNHS